MAKIVNLREFRKKRERRAKAAQAARNRAISGRAKADKARDSAALERQNDTLDGKKLTPGDDGSDQD